MNIINVESQELYDIEILPVDPDDYKKIAKSRYFFNWKGEQGFSVYKLQIKGREDILGLVSLEVIDEESRIQIRLLAVSKENRGSGKEFDYIAGNLIAYACIQAIKLFGDLACISLIPKTELIEHYMKEYSMLRAGKSLFLDGIELIQLIKKYDHEQ